MIIKLDGFMTQENQFFWSRYLQEQLKISNKSDIQPQLFLLIDTSDYVFKKTEKEVGDFKDTFSKPSSVRVGHKNGAHGKQGYDVDNGQYIKTGLKDLIYESQTRKQPEEKKQLEAKKQEKNPLFPSKPSLTYTKKLYSREKETSSFETKFGTFTIVDNPLDAKMECEIDGMKTNIEFGASHVHRVNIIYEKASLNGVAEVQCTADLYGHKLEGKAGFSAKNIEAKAGFGISGPNAHVGYSQEPTTFLGFSFAPNMSMSGGVGAQAEAGAGFTRTNGGLRCYFVIGAYAGLGGKLEVDIAIDFDTKLYDRTQKATEHYYSNNPWVKEALSGLAADLEREGSKKAEDPNFISRVFGKCYQNIKCAAIVEAMDDLRYNAGYLGALSAAMPHISKDNNNEQTSTQNLPQTTSSSQTLPNSEKYTDQEKAERLQQMQDHTDQIMKMLNPPEPSQCKIYPGYSENNSEASNVSHVASNAAPMADEYKTNAALFSNDLNKLGSNKHMLPEPEAQGEPDLNSNASTNPNQKQSSYTSQYHPFAKETQNPFGQRVLAEKNTKATQAMPKLDPMLNFGKKVADDYKDYIHQKIKQDAANARLQAPPSIPPQARSGFLNGITFKKDERGQDSINVQFNHGDSDNPHGMDIGAGISPRAIIEILRLIGVAAARVNYTAKQKDAYKLMNFMRKSDGSEAYHLEFKQRLQAADFTSAEKKLFMFTCLTGNTEELARLKRMILDKDTDPYKEIRSELQTLSHSLNSFEIANQDFFKRFDRNTKEDDLSLYTDVLYATLRPAVADTTKQGIYHAIGNILYNPNAAERAIHELCKDKREKDFKDAIEPKLKKIVEAYINAKPSKKVKKAENIEGFAKKHEAIYHDEMADSLLKFYHNRGKESDLNKAREILKNKGQIKNADEITHGLAKKHPNNKTYIEQSGIAYAQQGDFDQAVLQWQKLNTLSEESRNLLYRQLTQLEYNKKYPEAKELCEKFLASSQTADENYHFVHWYVSLCFDNNDYATGISELEKLMTDYGNDREKYEKTAGVLLNAYGLQAQKNDIPLNELKGEWLDKILNDTAFTDLNTILSVLKFRSLQGNNQETINCFKQCQINQNEVSKKQRKEIDAALSILLDNALCEGDYDQVDKIKNDVTEANNLPIFNRILKEIDEIRTQSNYCKSAQIIEAGGEMGLMMASQLDKKELIQFRKCAVSIFAIIKGTTTVLAASASQWLDLCKEKYRLNRILDSDALTADQRVDYKKQLSAVKNKSFLACSGTYHALSSILNTGKRWHEAFNRGERKINENVPVYAKLDALIVTSDSMALYLDASALKMDWDHKMDMANIAIQATRLAIETLVAADQLAEEYYGKGFGLKENKWIKEHLPESVRLASSAVAIANDLNVVTAAVHGASMVVPHALTDAYLNPTVAKLINKGEYMEGNGYISLAAVVGGFKNASKQVGSGAVISSTITVGKAAVSGAMAIPQVAAATAAVGNAAAAAGAVVAAKAAVAGSTLAAGTATASAAISAQAAAVMAVPQVAAATAVVGNAAAAGTAFVATNAVAAGTAIATSATAAGSAIATGASTFGAATGITAAAIAVGNAAAAGGTFVATNAAAVGSGAATAGGAAYSCISGIGASTGMTAAIEMAIPVVAEAASALATGTWSVIVTVAPVVGGVIIVVGVATVGYNIYCCQYNENTKQFYVNANIAIDKVDFDRAAEEMATYASRTQPAENQFSWTEQLSAMTPQALANYIVSDITKENIVKKNEQRSKHEKAAAEYANEKVYENTDAHDIILRTKNYELSIMPEDQELLRPKANKLYIAIKDGKILYRTKLSDSKHNKTAQELSIESLIQQETNPEAIQKLRDISKITNAEEALEQLKPFLPNILAMTQEKGYTEARKNLTLSELDLAIEKILQHIEKHPSLQVGGDDLVHCEYKKLKIIEKNEDDALEDRLKKVNTAIQFLDIPEKEIKEAKELRSAHLDNTQSLINQINKHSPYRGYDVLLMETPPEKSTLKKDTIYLYFDNQELKYVMEGTKETVLKTLSESERQTLKEKHTSSTDETCKKLEDYSADYMQAVFLETTKNGHTRFYLNKDVRNVPEITEEQKEAKEKDPIMQCHHLQENSQLPVQYMIARLQTTQILTHVLIQANRWLEYSFSQFNENASSVIQIENLNGELFYGINALKEKQKITLQDFLDIGVEKNTAILFFEELKISPDWLELVNAHRKEILAITSKRGHTSRIIDDNLIKLEKFSNISALIFDLTQLIKTSIDRQIECLLDPNGTQTSQSIINYFVSILQSQISLITDYHGFIKVFGYNIDTDEYKHGQEYWKTYLLPGLQLVISAAIIFAFRHEPWKVAKELGRAFYNLFKTPNLRQKLLQIDSSSLESFNASFFLGQFLENLDSNTSLKNVFNVNSAVFNYWTKAPEYIRGFLVTLVSWEKYGNRYLLGNAASPSAPERFSFGLFDSFFKSQAYFDKFTVIQQGINGFISFVDTCLNYKQAVLKNLIKQAMNKGNKAEAAYFYGLLYESENNISEAIRLYKEAFSIDNNHARANEKIRQLGSSEKASQVNVVMTHEESKNADHSSLRRAVIGIVGIAICANPASGSAAFLVSVISCLGHHEFNRNMILQPFTYLMRRQKIWTDSRDSSNTVSEKCDDSHMPDASESKGI